MNRNPLFIVIVGLCHAAIAYSAPNGNHDRQDDVNEPVFDCGVLSLYNLMRLEGHNTGLKSLDAALSSKTNCSLQDLRHAASKISITLTGVSIPKSSMTPDRPFLAFINRGRHGHFVVIRPVGHTGKLVQVLDPNTNPVVVDYSTIVSSANWSGYALVPQRLSDYLSSLFLVIYAIVGTCFIRAYWMRSPSESQGQSQ